MFQSIESKRYTKRLHNLLLRVFHEHLEDPIFQRLTINHLKLNRNKTVATVYLDLLSSSNPELVLQKLNKLNALFRSALTPYIDKYRMPYFRFVEDKLMNKAKKVEDLIFKGAQNAERN